MSQAGTFITGNTNPIDTITGNTGVPVVPAANNVNIIGSGGVTTSGAGSTLTISLTGPSSFTWSVIVADQAMVVNNGYVCNKAGLLSLSLPATAAVGSLLGVSNMNTAAGWIITQGAGQQIRAGTLTTTLGAGGSLAATQLGDGLTMVCIVANTTWMVVPGIQGNITVV